MRARLEPSLRALSRLRLVKSFLALRHEHEYEQRARCDVGNPVANFFATQKRGVNRAEDLVRFGDDVKTSPNPARKNPEQG